MEMKCDICNGLSPHIDDNVEFSIEKTTLTVSKTISYQTYAGSNYTEETIEVETKINFCPFCGKKL